MIKSFQKQKPTRLSRNKKAKLYAEVFETHNHQCQVPWCDSRNLDSAPHHIIYLSRGGSDVKWNLITLCVDCHRRVHGSKNILKIYHHDFIAVREIQKFIEDPVPYLIFHE